MIDAEKFLGEAERLAKAFERRRAELEKLALPEAAEDEKEAGAH